MANGGTNKDIERWLRESPDAESLYEVKDELGSGASGKTYYARVTKAGKERILRKKKGRLNLADIPNYMALKVCRVTPSFSVASSELESLMEKDFHEIGVEREGSIANIPHHDNNVIVYDAGKNEKVSWVGMEYVHEPFPIHALPLDQAVEAVIQLGRGIHHLHSQPGKIIHRDIKRENALVRAGSKKPGDLQRFKDKKETIEGEYEIKYGELHEQYLEMRNQQKMLTPGNIEKKQSLEQTIRQIKQQLYELKKTNIEKIKRYAELYGIIVKPGDGAKNCDYGLAKKMQLDTGDKITQGDIVKGTPQNMPPEQIRGVYNAQTDVYSLGATLYQIVTGEELYYSDVYEDIVQQICSNQIFPVDPRELNRNVDRDLAIIMAKTLHKEPKRRYRTADQFVGDLEKWRHNKSLGILGRLFYKHPLNRPDYTSFVFTRNIEPDKRAVSLGQRLTRTIAFPALYYQRAKESVEEIKSKPARWIAKFGVYLLPAAFVASIATAAYIAYRIGKSASAEKNNVEVIEKQND